MRGCSWLSVIAPLLALACNLGVRTNRVEYREYHGVPELVADPRFSASDQVVAQDGPLLVLHLREAGKPDFALDIFPRQYHLDPVDSTASYVFKVKIEYVTLGGGSEAVTMEIQQITKNGKRIYP